MTTVPEPAIFALLMGGLVMAYSFYRRRLKRV
ncbi:MAG: PEP-CTERM sorting domain-containing protein [Opitutales bacterium]